MICYFFIRIKKGGKTFHKDCLSTFAYFWCVKGLKVVALDHLILSDFYFNNLSDNSIILFPYFSRSFFRIILFTRSPAPIINSPKKPTIIPETYCEKLKTKLNPVPKTKTPTIPTKIDAKVAVFVM